jgi:hypothetical protein
MSQEKPSVLEQSLQAAIKHGQRLRAEAPEESDNAQSEQFRKEFGESAVHVETVINVEELEQRPLLAKVATPANACAVSQGNADRTASEPFDFVSAYVEYADVLEAPPEAHEAVATELLSSVLCENVIIRHGAIKIPLDLWVLLLSDSGFGRNTLIELVRPVVSAAGLDEVIRRTIWGSKAAFYQNIAEQPSGLFVWPELSVVLKRLSDKAFAGAKEWLTDRYDNLDVPDGIRYRETGKKSDTPPIVFKRSPRLNILATSSLDWFLSNLEQEDALGGFVPRWIVRKMGSGRIVPIPQSPDERCVPALAEHLNKASQLAGEANLSRVLHFYEHWYVKTRQRFSEHANPSLAMPFFNRLRTHVLKLAVIYEVSQSLSLNVTARGMGRAIKSAKASEEAIFALLATGLNREGSEIDRMAGVIRQAGSSGVPKSDLTRVFQSIRTGEREGRLATLLDAKTVRRFSRSTSGRSAIMLVHKDSAEQYHRLFPKDEEW